MMSSPSAWRTRRVPHHLVVQVVMFERLEAHRQFDFMVCYWDSVARPWRNFRFGAWYFFLACSTASLEISTP